MAEKKVTKNDSLVKQKSYEQQNKEFAEFIISNNCKVKGTKK